MRQGDKKPRLTLTYENGDGPTPYDWFEMCAELMKCYPDAARVAIVFSFEDGARVTFEQGEREDES